MKRVLTFGEAMLRLSPPGHLRLEQASSFDVRVGGAELNVAAGLARLGVAASFLTGLPDSPLGRLAAAEIRRAGVDDGPLLWRDEGRMGIYFVEFGASPRPSRVVYDRSGSAVSMLERADIDWTVLLGGFDHFHTTGITAALSPGCRELAGAGLKAAKERGLTTSFDLNFRARLWSESAARNSLSPMMRHIDHLITTEEDTRRVFGIDSDSYEEVARELVSGFGFSSAAITLREDVSVMRNRWTAIAWDGSSTYTDRTYDVEIIDRVGAGDAFSAGYIYGLLSSDIDLGLRVGNAMAAIKHSIPGDLPCCEREEVLALARGEGETRIRR